MAIGIARPRRGWASATSIGRLPSPTVRGPSRRVSRLKRIIRSRRRFTRTAPNVRPPSRPSVPRRITPKVRRRVTRIPTRTRSRARATVVRSPAERRRIKSMLGWNRRVKKKATVRRKTGAAIGLERSGRYSKTRTRANRTGSAALSRLRSKSRRLRRRVTRRASPAQRPTILRRRIGGRTGTRKLRETRRTSTLRAAGPPKSLPAAAVIPAPAAPAAPVSATVVNASYQPLSIEQIISRIIQQIISEGLV